MSGFLRFGNTVLAVDKIVSASFQPGDDEEGATLAIHFGLDHDEFVWCGEIAERIWAYWLYTTDDKTQEQSA